MFKIPLAVALLGVACGAEAFMFQWTSPDSGKVQLSGRPPAWYRAVEPGPRVLVFDNGTLIDDTAIAVPDAQRLVLRERAFGEGNSEQSPATARDKTRDELREAMSEAHELGIDVDAVTTEFNEALAAEETAEDTGGVEELADRVQTLKALIDAWDQQQGAQARELIERLPTNN